MIIGARSQKAMRDDGKKHDSPPLAYTSACELAFDTNCGLFRVFLNWQLLPIGQYVYLVVF